MSGEAPSDEKKDKQPGRCARMLAAPRQWPVAKQATALLVLFLVGLVCVCWAVFQFGVEHVPWQHYMTWYRLLGIVSLLVVIPFVFHRGIQLWLEGESSRFPDVEKAWYAGVQALQQQGLALDSAPLYLVLGSQGEQQERAIMNASPSQLSVVGVPKGPAPLHWYGNSEAIYLFCSDTSWLSTLSKLQKSIADEEVTFESHQQSEDLDCDPVENQSYPLPSSGKGLAPEQAPSGNVRGTIMLDQFVGGGAASRAMKGTTAAAASITGTMVLDAPVSRPTAAPTMSPASVSSQKKQTAVLASRESASRLQSLQCVCQLLRNARQPFCPINGVLALLPFATIDATGKELEELQRAVKADLGVIVDQLQLRVPVTALVVGMEEEAGFRELVRRVGRERSGSQRFGSRFDVRSEATTNHLSAFTAHVCGAFEDWVYTLFRERDALSRPGNPRLYGLLCKVRCILTHRLASILGKGFGTDDRDGNASAPHLFSGCYFAATGRSVDRQAFLQGVLAKLISEQEQTEWTDRAIAQDARYTRLLVLGYAVDVVLLALLASLLLL